MSFSPVLHPSSMNLLITPMNFPLVGSALCNLTGTLYPLYSTFKALEARVEAKKNEDNQAEPPKEDAGRDLRAWARYWAVFGSFKCIEGFSDPLLFWMPYYYPLKLCVLLWLTLPQFDGARYVYNHYLRPLLLKYQRKIDAVLSQLKQHEWIVEAQVPYLRMLFASLQLVRHNVVDWLKWFFSDNAGTGEQGSENEPGAVY